ncbi:complement factor H-like [Sinocyclocheilus anshuiensis]|uniref:complement factor H-like n=1 Tax=Sinocyclocheilus anshuiensis TaxID=1608454 RepID=UPI0007B9D101|nr:PREDICTED: complement factor H-like [Sinocyclocheilus anshuiensis]
MCYARSEKKCSHPGNTPNGDFKLTKGTEFVFGATVVYTCKKGYKMTSRTNQHTCTAQGWNNVVPICEVKCGPPSNINNADIKEMIKSEYNTGHRENIFLPHNDATEFACQKGKYLRGNKPLRQKCSDGVMTLPECV